MHFLQKALSPLSLGKSSDGVGRNLSWNAIGNLGYAALQFLTIVALARLGSASDLGTYAFASAAIVPVLALTGMQLRIVLATDAAKAYKLSTYLFVRYALTMLSIIVLIPVFFVFQSPQVGLACTLFLFARSVDAISDIYCGEAQRLERMDLYAQYRLLNGGATFILAALLLVLSANIATVAAGSLFASALSLVWLRDRISEKPLQSRLSERWRSNPLGSFSDARTLAFQCAPLGIAVSLSALLGSVPRLVVSQVEGNHAVGIFTATGYIMVLTNTLVLAVTSTLSPRLARSFSGREWLGFRSYSIKMLSIAVCAGVANVAAAAAMGGVLLATIYGDEFRSSRDILVILMVASVATFSGNVLGVILTTMRSFSSQIVAGGLALVVLAPLSYIFVTQYGLRGAAFATLIGSLVNTAYLAIVAFRVARSSFEVNQT